MSTNRTLLSAPHCPHCGVTVRDPEHRVCLQCGATLTPATNPQSSPAPSTVDPAQVMDQEAARLTNLGYRITNRTDTAIQAQKERQWSQVGLFLLIFLPAVLGCFFPPLWLVPIIGFGWVFPGYALSGGQLWYITLAQLSQQEAAAQAQAQQEAAETRAREVHRLQQQAQSRAAWDRRQAWLNTRWRSWGRGGQVAFIALISSGCLALLIGGLAVALFLSHTMNLFPLVTPTP